MKKSVLALSVSVALTALAGAANAQEVPFVADNATATQFVVNPDGVGHIQLVPYYTVQGNRNTLINIINTDETNGKVVKVRFRGARNSDDVFDFYVLLSPGDVWRSRVYRDGEQTKLESNDTSCTWPLNATANGGAAFPTERVFQNLESEVREGYVEILTAANVPPTTSVEVPSEVEGEDPVVTQQANPFFTAIKHVNGVAPCTETDIDAAIKPLTNEANALAAGLSYPSTGLIAQWAISDVTTNGTSSGITTALLAVNNERTPALGNIVVSPQLQDEAPEAWSTLGDPAQGTADPLFTQTERPTSYFDYPDLSTPYLISAPGTAVSSEEQANLVSSSLAVTEAINEFATVDADLQTDWVFSLPTRRYGVAIEYGSTANDSTVVENPLSQYFSEDQVALTTVNDVPALSINVTDTYWDDEESSATSTVIISPGTPVRSSIRGEVNVFSFNSNPENSLLGAEIAAQRINPTVNGQQVNAGWARIGLTADGTVPVAAGRAQGLPVIGFASISSAGNAMSFTWPHRFNRTIEDTPVTISTVADTAQAQ